VRSPPSGLKDSTASRASCPGGGHPAPSSCAFAIPSEPISASVAPFFRFSRPITISVLLPSRGALGSFARLRFLGRLFGFGRFLGRGGLLGRLALRGRALGGLCATLGLLVGLRLRCRFRLCEVAQSLNARPNPADCNLAALQLLYRLLTRQAIQNRHQALQSATLWPDPPVPALVLKVSNGVVLAVAASSAVANALIAFSWSIVKIVIVVLLCSALFAVITSITLLRSEGKAILNKIDDGEWLAMMVNFGRRPPSGNARTSPVPRLCASWRATPPSDRSIVRNLSRVRERRNVPTISTTPRRKNGNGWCPF
jgi:hypothetical protein